jgi:hypothetical protein
MDMDPEGGHFFVDIDHFESPVYGLVVRPPSGFLPKAAGGEDTKKHFMIIARRFVCQAAMNFFTPLGP